MAAEFIGELRATPAAVLRIDPERARRVIFGDVDRLLAGEGSTASCSRTWTGSGAC